MLLWMSKFVPSDVRFWRYCTPRSTDTQHTHHNLKHMLPQYCVNYNDVFLLIVSTKK